MGRSWRRCVFTVNTMKWWPSSSHWVIWHESLTFFPHFRTNVYHWCTANLLRAFLIILLYVWRCLFAKGLTQSFSEHIQNSPRCGLKWFIHCKSIAINIEMSSQLVPITKVSNSPYSSNSFVKKAVGSCHPFMLSCSPFFIHKPFSFSWWHHVNVQGIIIHLWKVPHQKCICWRIQLWDIPFCPWILYNHCTDCNEM